MTIDNIAYWVGVITVGFGGAFLALGIIGLLLYFACAVWVAFSDRFRDICKAESLIREYRKNRTEFMAWKGLKEIEDGNA